MLAARRLRVLRETGAQQSESSRELFIHPQAQSLQARVPVSRLARFSQAFAQLHLLHEKGRIHGRIRVLAGIGSLQTEQVTRARNRILEGLKGGVDLRR